MNNRVCCDFVLFGLAPLEDGVRRGRRDGNEHFSACNQRAADGDDSGGQFAREPRPLLHTALRVANRNAGEPPVVGARHHGAGRDHIAAAAECTGGNVRQRMRGRKRVGYLDQLVVAGAGRQRSFTQQSWHESGYSRCSRVGHAAVGRLVAVGGLSGGWKQPAQAGPLLPAVLVHDVHSGRLERLLQCDSRAVGGADHRCVPHGPQAQPRLQRRLPVLRQRPLLRCHPNGGQNA